MHLTCGSLRDLVAFFWLRVFSTSQTLSAQNLTRTENNMRIHKTTILLFVIIFLVACNRSARTDAETNTPSLPSSRTGSYEESIITSNTTRHFRLYIPSSYTGNAPIPLVLNFHGLKSNSAEQEALSGMSIKAEQEGFIVVYPDARNDQWAVGTNSESAIDKQFVLDLLEWMTSHYVIDQKRIFATGISNGGGMTNRLGCDMSNIIAAIAPDSGAYNFWQDCHPTRPIPVLAFHGLEDELIAYEGGTSNVMLPPIEKWAFAWAARNECSNSPEITTPVDTVTLRTWSNCLDNADVLLYTIANHGHSWPGSPIMPKSITSQAINATDVMWDFFINHPLP